MSKSKDTNTKLLVVRVLKFVACAVFGYSATKFLPLTWNSGIMVACFLAYGHLTRLEAFLEVKRSLET